MIRTLGFFRCDATHSVQASRKRATKFYRDNIDNFHLHPNGVGIAGFDRRTVGNFTRNFPKGFNDSKTPVKPHRENIIDFPQKFNAV